MKRFPFYPILFSLYVVLFLFAHNFQYLSPHDVYRPLLFVVVGTILMWILFSLLYRDWNKGALLTCVFLMLFFSYFLVLLLPFIESVKELLPFRILHKYYWILILIIFLPFFVLAYALKFRKINVQKVNYFFNLMTFFLLLFALGNLAVQNLSFIQKSAKGNFKLPLPEIKRETLWLKIRNFPDIYYIILDGYGRQDVLKELYGFDNNSFLNFLEEKGFFVARRSFSNYCQTYLSLASSLNFSYLDWIPEKYGKDVTGRTPLVRLIRHNRLMRFLKKLNYKVIAFASGYSGTELRRADVYIRPPGLTEFENLLLLRTPLGFLSIDKEGGIQYKLHRQRLLFILDNIATLPEEKRPRIVFAHIIMPHPPFVFDSEGNPVNPSRPFSIRDGSHYFAESEESKEDYRRKYVAQLKFLNKKLSHLISQLLSKDPEAIIILQADHGPGSLLSWETVKKTDIKERFGILNAYYLPGGCYGWIWQTISPVNTFRVILNRYFGTELSLLPDRAFYSPWLYPYRFVEVTSHLLK